MSNLLWKDLPSMLQDGTTTNNRQSIGITINNIYAKTTAPIPYAKTTTQTTDTMDLSTQNIGKSVETISNDNTAVKLYTLSMERLGDKGDFKQFQNLQLEDIDGDKVVLLFKKYMKILVDNKIPKGWYVNNGEGFLKSRRIRKA